MKGFPNQVADLEKLSLAMGVIDNLLSGGENPRKDSVLGEALVRAGVAGTGHTPKPVEEYLAEQREKKPSNRAFHTTARGLRELFRILGLIRVVDDRVDVTPRGRRAVEFAEHDLTPEHVAFWRRVIQNMCHDGGGGETSHPYQVLLRLIARRPGITRAKCALALEAGNDSEEELQRIVALADMDEDDIREAIGVTKTNWDNAKKILPKFAEQLADVRKERGQFYLSDAPGAAAEPICAEEAPGPERGPRRPRTASRVTASSIAKAGTSEDSDETDDAPLAGLSPEALKERRDKLLDRLKRHNLMVQDVAASLEGEGVELYENPFDCLACFDDSGLLVEVKTLDGTEPDERIRVREALAQLLYYESFVTPAVAEGRAVVKVACFESKVSDDHISWLQKSDIQVIWRGEEGYEADPLSREQLSGRFGF